jgi:hypothetical protein
MKGWGIILVLSFGFLFEVRCQELYFSVAARCSIPLNSPFQRSFYFDISYVDTTWVVDWIKVDFAPAYLFTTIDQFTVNDRTSSIGVGGGKASYLSSRVELRVGLMLRYLYIERFVKTGSSNRDEGSYSSQGVGIEMPWRLTWRVWNASPLHFFVEGTPGFTKVIRQRTYGRPDPAMKVRSNPSLAVVAGFMYQF